MLSQQAMLFPHLSVAANVAYAPRCKGESRRPPAPPRGAGSGGRRRGSRGPPTGANSPEARHSASPSPARWPPNPRLLLLDEPMAALDVTAAPGAAQAAARASCANSGRTAVIVTHDLLDALAIADKVVVFENAAGSWRAAPVREC